MKLNRILRSAAAVGTLALASMSASAYQAFTVDESAVPGAVANTFVADQINGTYVETITATIPGSFITSGVFEFSGFTFNNSPPAGGTQLEGVGAGGYSLYALFEFSGSAGVNLAGDIVFNANSGSAELWLDAGQDSSFTQNATGAAFPTVTAGTADVLLGSVSSLQVGEGTGELGLANGNFEIVFDDFALTVAGQSYFIKPTPFYMVLDINGNFQDFSPVPVAGQEFTSEVTGAGQVFFKVPEPSAVALFATGLLALGLAGRRRRRV
ncbi:MAG: hypothetical protein CMK32_16290 [Porticoccaceae bacterium]|nr:hypothetical protein [Porticoccaceae bacterium]